MEKECIIFLMKDINNIWKEYFSEELLIRNQNNGKNVNGCYTDIVFEMVRDLGDPTLKWLPFIFH